jgi:hypothetical protein
MYKHFYLNMKLSAAKLPILATSVIMYLLELEGRGGKKEGGPL